MAKYAREQDGVVAEIAELPAVPTEMFHPDLAKHWHPAAAEVQVGWAFANGGFSVATVTANTAVRYVPLSLIGDRLRASGQWSAFAAAVDGLPADKRWHLLTLREGVASDDADALALLAAIGADPTVVLA